MKIIALLLLASSCASDPYLASTLDCVNKAATRAAADACRAGLQDAGVAPKDSAKEDSHGG